MRCGVIRVAGTAASVLVAAAVFAQQPPAAKPAGGKKAPVEDVIVRTKDNWSLPVTFFPVPNKETPVVILLHGKDGNRLLWKGFAEPLQQAGYAVAAVDLRKHGESQPPAGANPRSSKVSPADHQNMVRFDLEAVKDFLLEKHNAGQLNIRKLAVVAADDAAPVAANWALADWLKEPYSDAPTFEARTPRGRDVRALVLLSPTEGIGGLNLGKALPKLRTPAIGIAAFIAVGELDKDDKQTSLKSYERLAPNDEKAAGKRVFLETYPQNKARGIELLAATRGRAQAQIIGFLGDHLQKLPDPWVTRKSKLQ